MSSWFQEFGHLQIPLEDITSTTHSFADENLIGESGFGKIYQGQLMQSTGQLVDIAAWRLDRRYEQGEVEFLTEVSMLSRLNHTNIISIFGFCDENGEKVIVTERAVNGGLDKHLSSPTLTWMQRLGICIDAARALNYIHHDPGRSYGVIHRDVKSSNILLDQNWEVKLCGFNLSILYLANRGNHVLSHACGTMAYTDPVYRETGTVTAKSDVYSLGVVLFEVLCGREAREGDEGGRQFLAPLAKECYEGGNLDEIIDPGLRRQMGPQSLIIFSDTAYRCLNMERTQRPDMENVVKNLEKALQLQRTYENPESSRTPAEGTSSYSPKLGDLEHLKIQLRDIHLATDNFTKNCIGTGAYGAVYETELSYYDGRTLPTVEERNKDEIPKRHGSVAIKRIFSRGDEQGERGFLAEIDLLTSCMHHNIVSLLGFCHEDCERILIYELASNGSLANYLTKTDKVTTLTWMQRINMCLDIARGLNYLHTATESKPPIIHRDIKSDNILLFEKWMAKIADFGLSRFHPVSTVITGFAGTEVYMDPEYFSEGNLKKESDVYSFGVVLFEILCGRLAYDPIYYSENDKGLPSVVRQRFKKEMIDPILKEETYGNTFNLHRGPNQDSLDTMLRIGFKCLVETQAGRPATEFVIKELVKASYFQENNKDSLKLSLEDIKLATHYFSDDNCIGSGVSGKVYQGEVRHPNRHKIIAVKQFDRSFDQYEHQFLAELEILFEYKHDRIIGLLGYCDEEGEKLVVYEYPSRGSLDRYLNDGCLTWMKRLEICIDVAIGLDFLHGGSLMQEVVIHRDIKSSNILLNEDWKAKISDFGLSMMCPINKEIDYVIESFVGTVGYCDPIYLRSGILSKESDIYSFGVVLFEILCGRPLGAVDYEDPEYLINVVKDKWNEGRLEEIVFEGIKDDIVPESLTAYSKIAYQCLDDARERRPTANGVLKQLKKALKFQVDHDVWEPKLPRDYKNIIEMTSSPEIYLGLTKEDLYSLFLKGILLQKDKLCFSLSSNGKRNEMISAKKFLYKNRMSLKWRSFPKSRFPKVAEMSDIKNLKIQIKIRTQLLSPGVNYGVHLICRFCGPRKSIAKRMYVNLKYKIRNEKLHAYFATWREDEWMMIELFQPYNCKEENDFEVEVESFSRCYSGSDAFYIEGIEFRAIENVKHEEIEKPKEVPVMKSSLKRVNNVKFKRSENYEEGRKLHFLASRMQTMEDQIFFVKNKVLNETFDRELVNSRPEVEFRFEGVTELLRHQVFYIKCKMKNQKLSPNVEYVCYLVFKLSENCFGLHCPVRVRDLHYWRKKETGIVYLRTPSPWNLHNTDWVPKKRTDGWMEVIVWRFNSTYQLENEDLLVNLKLISYEGTMSGLILRGLEFWPM